MSTLRIKKVLTGIALVSSTVLCLGQEEHWEAILIPADSGRYIIPDAATPTDWINPGFDDLSWTLGSGGVGYGDDDDLIIIPNGTMSVFLRQKFIVDDLSAVSDLILEADVDDGFVAYLNGTEVARYNLGTEGVRPAYDLGSDIATEPKLAAGNLPLRYTLSSWTSLLVQGVNVLAFEVHNYGTSSSDLSSNLYLMGTVSGTEIVYHTTPDWFVEPMGGFTSNLPIIRINTNGQTIIKDSRITASMGVVDHGYGNTNISDEDFNGYDGQISIKIRGESSTMFDKKSYTLETQTDSGTNNNVPLLGLPAENDWVLHGPYSDKSLMRNVLMFGLSNKMGLYAPRTQYCELIINDDYKGVYVLLEQIKQDKNRVDIAKLNPEDIEGDELTGGYIFRVDKTTDMAYYEYWTDSIVSPYSSSYNVYQYYDPDYADLAPAQRAYLKSHLIEFEENLKDAFFDDPEYGYYQYLNVQSFVDALIVSEFGKEVDSYRFSCYFNKDKDSNGGKIVAGPLWDRNLAFGNVDYGGTINQPSGWLYKDSGRVWWWRKLMEDLVFSDRVHCRWDDMYADLFSYESITSMMDSCINYMGDAIARNYERWPVLGVYVWPNSFVGNTYEEEIDHLKEWISDRLVYMEAQWGGFCQNLYTGDEPVIELPGALSVYPNPSGFEEVIFERYITEPADWIHLAIYDHSGKLVDEIHQETSLSGKNTLVWTNGASFAPGIYIYRWTESTGEIQTGKLVKYN